MLRIAIIGGGFSGASAAVQLVRKSPVAVAVTIIEPRKEVGRGLAYSTNDPVFRLNAHAGMHSIDIADPAHLIRWCIAQDLPASDPDCVAPNGQFFIRRMDFGRYVVDALAEHADWPSTGSTIRHHRAAANGLQKSGGAWQVTCDDGHAIQADRVIIATGNPPARLPTVLKGIAGHPGLVGNPLQYAALGKIASDAKVLVIGAGLTALDMIATLLRQGHRGSVTVVSRRGLRPRPQPPATFEPPNAGGAPPVLLLDLLGSPLPPYAEGTPLTALGLLIGLRAQIAGDANRGLPWQLPFDLIAAVVWQVWPRLSTREKLRFLGRLKPWWDVHRFRTPPMTEAIVRKGEASDKVRFETAAVRDARIIGDRLAVALQAPGRGTNERQFDAVINCTGLEAGSDLAANPLLAALASGGLITAHPSGVGVAVNPDCEPLARNFAQIKGMHLIGPPSAGEFGDPVGVLFIAAQIHRIIPGIVGLS